MNNLVFISYARLDQDFVLQLAQALQERRVSVWIDQWNIPTGADWDRAIDNAIRDCEQFLIVLSPASTFSEYSGEVRGELRRALDLKKDVIPVLYQQCQIPRQLLHIEYSDFTAGFSAVRVELLSQRLRGEKTEAPLSDRMKFIKGVEGVPEDARALDNQFTKAVALELSKRLSNDQFDALSQLGAKRIRYDHGARGIVRSLALKRLEVSEWEATSIFDVLVQLGFLSLSQDPRERNDPDPGYDYTPLFFGYVNLQRYLGIREPLVPKQA